MFAERLWLAAQVQQQQSERCGRDWTKAGNGPRTYAEAEAADGAGAGAGFWELGQLLLTCHLSLLVFALALYLSGRCHSQCLVAGGLTVREGADRGEHSLFACPLMLLANAMFGLRAECENCVRVCVCM